jgi:hypothetical protein
VSTVQAGVGSGQVYALLADGTTVEIRPAGPGDFGAVKAMHEALSPDNTNEKLDVSSNDMLL